MSTTLKEALSKIDIPLSEEEIQSDMDALINKHRSKNVLERPQSQVELKSMLPYDFEPRKEQRDPTEDLVILPRVVNELHRDMFNKADMEDGQPGFVIYCSWSEDTWFCPTRKCLDTNFIYRNDIDIYEVEDDELAYQTAVKLTGDLYPGVVPKKVCYVLDDPGNETYEVYYDVNFPKAKYGKTTPNGMFIHRYANRFHRDMFILEIDAYYSNSSSKQAGKLVSKGYDVDEAIIISDGCWLRNSCASSFVYLDKTDVVSQTRGFLPSEPEQSVLIAEIVAAMDAIRYAVNRDKKNITLYYDNSSIINVFRNRRMEYLPEIVEYKQLLTSLSDTSISLTFTDIHPKSGENREEENKALMYFHNMCDRSCREMTEVFKKDYRSIASNGSKVGDSVTGVVNKFKPKGKPGTPTGRMPKSNVRTGNNKSGRRF